MARRRAELLIDTLGIARPPVEVDAIARHLGARVVVASLDDDVSGMLVRNGSNVVISVNRAEHSNRQRFSIAHEIGHLYLEHQFESGPHVHVDRGSFVSHRGPRASEGSDPMEIEANQFASVLLMPTRLVKERAAALGAALGEEAVKKLATEFKVSEQAMTIRLTALGLL